MTVIPAVACWSAASCLSRANPERRIPSWIRKHLQSGSNALRTRRRKQFRWKSRRQDADRAPTSANDLDERRLVGPERFLKCRFELIARRDSQAERTERFGKLHEIRIDEVHRDTPAVVLGILQRSDACQAPVIDYDGDNIDAVLNRRHQFLSGHQEATIA